MKEYKKRSDVPEKYKWDLTEFYKDLNEFEKSLKKTEKLVAKEKNFVGCTKDADRLYEFLQKDSELESEVMNLYAYAYLINDQELGNSKSIEQKGKTENLYAMYVNNTSFFKPELLALSKKEYDNLFKKNDKLNKYKPLLDKTYRYKDHVLTEKEEQIINDLSNAMNHYDDMSSTMLNSEHDYGYVELDGKETQILSTNLRKLLKNKNQDKRQEIYSKFNKILDQYGTSSAQFLNSYVKANIAVSRIKGYKDAWDSKLFGLNMSNNVFTTLVNSVEDNVDALQDYFKLLKKELKLKELNSYDLNMEMTNLEKEYTIEDALDIIRKSLKPLGNEYLEHFEKIVKNRYIDYCEYKGKCSGGYSFSTMNKDSRILMSYNGNLDSVSTIIHEAGHNIHHQYVSENNDPVYRMIPVIISEVFSLTNECLLASYIANNAKTKEEKKAGIEHILNVIVSNLFGAVREGKMEQDFYDYVSSGNTITKEYMDNLTMDSLKKYYGTTVKLNDYAKCSWARRSHYYANYYLYSYAICISVATQTASKILSGDKKTLENYMKFIKTGSNVWPIDAMKILGVDLEKEDVYLDAINYFRSLIKKYKDIDKEV